MAIWCVRSVAALVSDACMTLLYAVGVALCDQFASRFVWLDLSTLFSFGMSLTSLWRLSGPAVSVWSLVVGLPRHVSWVLETPQHSRHIRFKPREIRLEARIPGANWIRP
ncbi:hypothetical protein EV363DRAFT_1326941 [Boletus edulis]|nr:hypothetical protein EV363DRAFT_1326941 [Boletus edulis]